MGSFALACSGLPQVWPTPSLAPTGNDRFRTLPAVVTPPHGMLYTSAPGASKQPRSPPQREPCPPQACSPTAQRPRSPPSHLELEADICRNRDLITGHGGRDDQARRVGSQPARQGVPEPPDTRFFGWAPSGSGGRRRVLEHLSLHERPQSTDENVHTIARRTESTGGGKNSVNGTLRVWGLA